MKSILTKLSHMRVAPLLELGVFVTNVIERPTLNTRRLSITIECIMEHQNNAPYSSDVEHLPKCYVGKPDLADHTHNWSGWPGAYCTICHISDPTESCLGDCECPCHDDFWLEYAWSQLEPVIKKYEGEGWVFNELQEEDGTFQVTALKSKIGIAGSGGQKSVLDAWCGVIRSIDAWVAADESFA